MGDIPKIFHFIWIGPYQIPTKYVGYIQSWIKHHPDWKFYIWTDENLPDIINRDLYNRAEKMAMKADILRYEILYNYGGVYVDCDFQCFKSISNAVANCSAFSAWECQNYIAIGLMGFHPHHSFLLEVLSQVRKNMAAEDLSQVNCITGPVMFTEVWKSFQLKNPDLKMFLFPSDFCYPYSYWDHVYKKKVQIKENSYAMHMWGASWHQPDGYFTKEINDFKKIFEKDLITQDGLIYIPKG